MAGKEPFIEESRSPNFPPLVKQTYLVGGENERLSGRKINHISESDYKGAQDRLEKEPGRRTGLIKEDTPVPHLSGENYFLPLGEVQIGWMVMNQAAQYRAIRILAEDTDKKDALERWLFFAQ